MLTLSNIFPKQAVVFAKKPTKIIEVGVSSGCPMASHTFQDKIFKSAPVTNLVAILNPFYNEH